MPITDVIFTAQAFGPYVQLIASATGALTVTVNRYDISGKSVIVRGGQDADVSSGLWQGYDFEAPQGRDLRYRAVFSDGTDTETVEVTAEGQVNYGGDWIMPVGRHELGMNIYVEYDGIGDLERDVIRDIVPIVNRPSPIVVSWGRQMWNGEITFLTLEDAERRRFLQLLAYPVIMFAARPGYGFDEPLFASIGAVTEARTTGLGRETSRRWEVELQEIQRPPATYTPPPPEFTWQTRLDEDNTWGEVLGSEVTWFEYAGYG